MKKFFLQAKDFINTREYLKVLLTFTIFFAVFSLAYFSLATLSSGDDHFFHFRFAEHLRQNGFLNSFHDFKSIYLSKIAQGGDYAVYYNFLFYLVLIPFTYIEPLFLAIKLYAVLIAALSFTLIYWCCLRLNIKHSLIWVGVIFALTNHVGIWRLFLSRPYALAPALLLMLVVFLKRRNYWGVFTINLIYLFWHSATFFFPLGVTIVYYIAERFYRDRTGMRNLIYALGGLVSALTLVHFLSPGFLSYIKDNIFGIYFETILGKKVILAEGVELYPQDFFDFLRNNSLIIAGLLLAGGAEVYQYFSARFRNHESTEYLSGSAAGRPLQLALFFLTIGTWLGTTAVSGRFGDFFMFFAALYLIVALESLRRFVSISDRFVKRGVIIGLTVMIIYLFAGNVLFLQQVLARGASVNEFSGVGEWLKANTKPGDVVFDTNWSWFPQLYYHSPENYYIAGLEPRFFYLYSPDLYWKWWNLGSHGYVCNLEECKDKTSEQRLAWRRDDTREKWIKNEATIAAKVIKTDLRTDYIVTAKNYRLFNILLEDKDHFKRVYNDDAYAVYQPL